MGLFNRLSTFFSGAPKAEIDKANETLKGIAADLVIADEEPTTPATPEWKPNRAQRRAHSKGLRFRDRNTAFGRRDREASPRRQHGIVNDKSFQYLANPLLQRLTAPYLSKEVSA